MIMVDEANPMPPYEQIRSQLSALIKVGTLIGGERLPSVRQLSKDLRLAPGTVARAYSMLETEGLLVTGRGAGTRVNQGVVTHPALAVIAGNFAKAAAEKGLTIDEALLIVRAAWS